MKQLQRQHEEEQLNHEKAVNEIQASFNAEFKKNQYEVNNR